MRKTFFIFFCLLLFSVNAFSYDFTLSGIKTNTNTVTVYRGKSMQTVSDDSFLISMYAEKNDHGIQFNTSITNYSGKEYFFHENCISVYQGIYEDGTWTKLAYSPASQYYQSEIRNIQSEEIASAIVLGLNAASAGYSRVNGSGYAYGYRYTYNASIYSPADAAIATANSYIALDNMQQRNQNYLDFLENSLLFDSYIPNNDNYNGIFVVNEKKGPDYKVVFELNPGEVFEFYFTRSDKQEILDPWMDKSHDRYNIVFGFDPRMNHYSLYTNWLRPKGIGFYYGVFFRKEKNSISPLSSSYNANSIHYYEMGYANPLGSNHDYYYYDWKFERVDSTMFYDSFGMSFGISFKVIPNLWASTGIGFELADNIFYYGDFYYKYKGDYRGNSATDYIFYQTGYFKDEDCSVLFTPQLGVNYITGPIDFGLMGNFPIKGKPSFDISIGYVFK